MIPFLRFIILQVILASALVALWFSGPLADALAGHAKWGVAFVLTAGAIGLILTGAGRLVDAAKLMDMMPLIAVIGMQLGLLPALKIMGASIGSSGDPGPAVGAFIAALSVALYVSVTALCSYLWLKLTLWLAHGE